MARKEGPPSPKRLPLVGEKGGAFPLRLHDICRESNNSTEEFPANQTERGKSRAEKEQTLVGLSASVPIAGQNGFQPGCAETAGQIRG
jgi:hypothetical protein